MSDILTDEELETAAEMADAGIPESPRITRRIVAELRELRTFLLTLQGGLVGPAGDAKVLTDAEVDAIEALIRAAIRWTGEDGRGTNSPARVMPDFGLLMADYRRLRRQGGWLEKASEETAEFVGDGYSLGYKGAAILAILRKHLDG